MVTWNLTFLIGLGIWAGPHTALCQDSPSTKYDRLTVSSLEGTAAHAIVQVAIENHLPLGLVLDKHSLCKVNLHSLDTREISARQFASELNIQLNDYDFRWADGVLTGRPRALDPNVADLLNYQIRQFRTRPMDTHLAMAESLWTFIRAQLYPDQGTGFMGSVPPNEESVTGFSASDQTVQELLDHIARVGSGAAWVIKPRSVDWKKSGTIPFSMYAFVGYADELSRSICEDDGDNQSDSKPHP